jgi:hypothetical protein
MKSNIEIKVSAGSVEAAQAFAAAEAGLEANFVYWRFDATGKAEYEVVKQATADTYTYISTLTPTSMSDLYIKAVAVNASYNIDDLIQNETDIRVYNITSAGMAVTANSNWTVSPHAQVAVWATHFEDGYSYPYKSPNSGTCANCQLGVYSLGAFGGARTLMREIVKVKPGTIDGVSAMSNAPAYRSWADMCSGTRSTSPGSPAGTNEAGSSVQWRNGEVNGANDILIEVTQAEYTTGVAPSGIALKSNTNVGGEGKNFREDVNTTTIASFDSIPYIVFAGHGPSAADNAIGVLRYDAATHPDINPAVNLPSGKLPQLLISEPLLGTDAELEFFPPGEPNAQLFDLDAYRWGAEQFTYQGSGNSANGKYAAKGEALRTAMGVPAGGAVTGRINMAQFEYNLANGIPMFGVTRVMYPVYQMSNTKLARCPALGAGTAGDVYPFDTEDPTASLTDSGTYNGTVTALDSDGELGSSTKLVSYGAMLFDFFIDLDGDGFFDPADGERLINAFEAVDARMELEMGDYMNPALPDIPSPQDFYTAAGGTITRGSSSKPVNLASPTGGWFPITELRIPTSSTDSHGQMKSVVALVEAGRQMAPSTGSQGGDDATFATSDAPTIYTTYKTRLDYYYRLMRATAKQSDPNSWPINPTTLPSAITDNICIGVADCAVGNNDGDSFHTLFPSGYHHGWKISFAALNIKAAEWNSIFSNLNALALLHDNGTNGYNYGSGTLPKGSAFNTSDTGATAISDVGFSRALSTGDLKDRQNEYFNATAHASGYILLDSDFADMPSQMYAGGIVDMHKHNNMTGVIYTPGPLEWETGHTSGATGYVNGSIITGFGTFTETKGITDVVLVYDNQSVDNLPCNTDECAEDLYYRYARQELK